MTEVVRKPKLEYRNIGIGDIARHYRLPIAGQLSIFHRISGVLLFLSLPFLLFLFDKSLTSELSFAVFKAFLSNSIVKLIVLVLAWAFLHHFCAGIRHLLMDVNHHAVTKESGKRTAIVVFVVSLSLTLVFALKLLGVF